MSILITLALAAPEPELSGRVVGIADGDTITVLVDKVGVKIRLDGIDAPERGQAFGARSRETISELVFGKTVRVVTKGKDRYGRTIGVVFVDGVNVNAKMIETGFAWHYKRYSTDAELDRLEREARREKRGLWNDPAPVEPWNWRARGKAKAA
jgi:endonuclease YncB( thermonuclease family)